MPGSELPTTRPGRGQNAVAAKATLRRGARRGRRQHSRHWLAWASAQLSRRLAGWLIARGFAHVALFVAVPGEPSLAAAAAALWAAERAVYLPRRRRRGGLDFARWRAGDRLERGAGGLWQPRGPAGPVARLQAVVMPGLAFDLGGGRLGQGGGAFDRALAACPAVRVGAAWEAAVWPPGERLPAAPHDLAVSHLVTERRLRVIFAGGHL